MATTLDPRRQPHHPTSAEQRPHGAVPRQRRATRSEHREPVVLADALGEVIDTLLECSHAPEHS
ncbi:hypothetical protein [Nocardiopsis alkaliphila]|uniref:hypothetical protein n=1 Tax=Nocardiopsis alkaliphila TaxID=225762 RepID=UPI0003602585|nr:hypothetical protein [Nocardiopsis alkaliphila]